MTEQTRSSATSALQWLHMHRWRALVFTLTGVAAVHLIAASVTIRHSNQDPVASDQGAEMWLAATSRADLFPQRTDGVRHPLWSWVARFLYTENEAKFFQRGKWLNTLVCVLFLCGLGVAVTRWLDPLATANLLLLASLGILLVRGTYFQPEPFYYLWFFLAAILGWRILRGASLWVYGVVWRRLRPGLSFQTFAGTIPGRLRSGTCLSRSVDSARSKYSMEHCTKFHRPGPFDRDCRGDASSAGKF